MELKVIIALIAVFLLCLYAAVEFIRTQKAVIETHKNISKHWKNAYEEAERILETRYMELIKLASLTVQLDTMREEGLDVDFQWDLTMDEIRRFLDADN